MTPIGSILIILFAAWCLIKCQKQINEGTK